MVFITSGSYNYGQSSLPRDHYVILPFDKNVYPTLAKKSIPASLNDSDFVIIDRVLSLCIDKYNQEQTAEYEKMIKKFPEDGFQIKDFVIDLKRYYRQYMVIKNAKGEKEVWVNCFCSVQHMDYLTKEIVRVQDGGNCFFNVRINLTKKTFAGFEVNGEA
jgi:hypothetical protein